MKLKIYLYLSTLLYFLILSCFSYRLEPLNIFKQKEEFYNKYFPKFTDKLKLNYTDTKGYHCIVDEEVKINDILFKIPINFTYSVYDDFPLKNTFFDIISENKKNMTNNILLTTRLLFDIKANKTEIFILIKKYGETDEINYPLDSFRNYLKSRTDFFYEFLKNLPQTYHFGETSWSEDDIIQYSQTGSIPVFKKELIKIYFTMIESLNRSVILSKFTKNWLNEENLSHFLSLYGFVASKSFKLKLEGNFSDKNAINTKLEGLGGITLIPFLDLCSAGFNNKLDSKVPNDIKLENQSEIAVYANNNYHKSEEFSSPNLENLSNDYLILNHGFIIKNNPNQEYIFKFDIMDKDYNFYNKLKSGGFDIKMITIITEHKLSIRFPLKSDKISRDLLSFIQIFLSMFKSQEEEKFHKLKIYKNLLASIDKISLKHIKNHLLYYITIEKNIRKIFEDGEIIDANNLYDAMIETKRKISKSNQIIIYNTEQFYKERNLTSFSDDDFQNLFYFKTLHTLLKRDLIQEFNWENLKILYKQENIALNNTIKNFDKNIKQLKKKYI